MYKVRYTGMGAEEFGPPAPTVTQQVTQAVTDVSRTVEETTGLRNFAYYAGIALIGWVAYTYMTTESR
jgi:hypothetical protein